MKKQEFEDRKTADIPAIDATGSRVMLEEHTTFQRELYADGAWSDWAPWRTAVILRGEELLLDRDDHTFIATTSRQRFTKA